MSEEKKKATVIVTIVLCVIAVVVLLIVWLGNINARRISEIRTERSSYVSEDSAPLFIPSDDYLLFTK